MLYPHVARPILLHRSGSGRFAKQRAGSPVAPPPGTGGPADLLGQLFGRKEDTPSAANRAGFPTSPGMLDLDGDGNPLDDILQMAGRAFRQEAMNLVISLIIGVVRWLASSSAPGAINDR